MITSHWLQDGIPSVDPFSDAYKVGEKPDCNVLFRIVASSNAPRKVCAGEASFSQCVVCFDINHPTTYRVLVHLSVVQNCPMNVQHHPFSSGFYAHSPQWKVGPKNIRLCSNSSDMETRLFDAGIPASAFPRTVRCVNVTTLNQLELTFASWMLELVKELLPISHHVRLFFSTWKRHTWLWGYSIEFDHNRRRLLLNSCHTSVKGAVLNLPRIMSCCESQTYSQCFASFGNPTRMDYGTGHETMFVFFLLCLEEIGLVTVEDHRALVCRVFAKYVSVVRTLQTVYWSVLFSIVWLSTVYRPCVHRLEPAGSKGVWGLDDYCFLPFYW